MVKEGDLIQFLLKLDPSSLAETMVLPELTITQHPDGLRLTHQLQGGQVEVEHHKKAGDATITIRLDNVFGQSKTLYISQGSVQVDDRVYEYKKTVARLSPVRG
ncbi:MAG TPA: hypothetical protein VGC42_07285 [Kofleriaceae bacterium]